MAFTLDHLGSAWILRFQRSDLDAIENGILEKVKEKRQAKLGRFGWLMWYDFVQQMGKKTEE